MNRQILHACIELVDDAKMSCADLVFKEVCLEILCRASHVLPQKQFKELSVYVAERMQEKRLFELQHELSIKHP